MLTQSPDVPDLRDVLTPSAPLGPVASEYLVGAGAEIFSLLYDATNHIHRSTRTDNPSYIVGRKGSGKTAFLLGGAIVEQADVVLLKSEHIYTEVNRLNTKYAAVNGTLVADSLVHVWEVLLCHAAMWGVTTSDRLPISQERLRLWSYMSGFGDPLGLAADELLARVSGRLTEALLTAPGHLSFREACLQLDNDRGTFIDAMGQLTRLMDRHADALYVVVDNLEDLHKHLDEFSPLIAGLFRVVSQAGRSSLPFRTRFAFPAELLPQLRQLAANPEKDFNSHLVVEWNARELLVIAGTRLRRFLDLYVKDAWRSLQLSRQHDAHDPEQAERTLRAVLGTDRVVNGFGQSEDPIAYIVRHTQLLPRQLIQILNEIIGPAFMAAAPGTLPPITSDRIKAGVHRAEHVIVEGILAAYQHEYPHVGEALRYIKNHAQVVQPASELHREFNRSGAARSNLDFDEFLQASLAVGALGVVTNDDSMARYVKGEFAYTFSEPNRLVEDADAVCIHPLFMYRWFDSRVIGRMGGQGVRAVYPYGTYDDPLD